MTVRAAGTGASGERLTIFLGLCAEHFSELIACLRAHEVGRVGLEATGGYERGVCTALAAVRGRGWSVDVLTVRDGRAARSNDFRNYVEFPS
jgi:hypothetical protein